MLATLRIPKDRRRDVLPFLWLFKDPRELLVEMLQSSVF